MMKYYPCIFERRKKSIGFNVRIPDFDAETDGTNLANAMEKAQDKIIIEILIRKDEGMFIASPSYGEDVAKECKEGQFVVLIGVNPDKHTHIGG